MCPHEYLLKVSVAWLLQKHLIVCFVLVRLLSEDTPDIKALFSCKTFTNCTYERLNLQHCFGVIWRLSAVCLHILHPLFCRIKKKKKKHCLGIFLTCWPPSLKYLRIMECVSWFLSFVIFSHGKQHNISVWVSGINTNFREVYKMTAVSVYFAYFLESYIQSINKTMIYLL